MTSEKITIYRTNESETQVIEQYPKTISTQVYDVNGEQFLNETITQISDKIDILTDEAIHVTPTDVTTWNGYDARIHALENSTANYTTTVGTSWIGTSAPFTQTIAVSGILSTDNPIIFPIYSSDNTTAIAEQLAWSSIGKITTINNSITLTCFEEKPTTALTLQLKVVR